MSGAAEDRNIWTALVPQESTAVKFSLAWGFDNCRKKPGRGSVRTGASPPLPPRRVNLSSHQIFAGRRSLLKVRAALKKLLGKLLLATR
jgi:hypothetical protein